MHRKHIFRLLLLLGVVWGWGSPWQQAWARKGNKRCLRKRVRCRKRCKVKAFRRERKCRKTVLKKRSRCIKIAYRRGRRCVKKLECPKADKCYADCKDKSDPVACYAKEGCAKMKEKCYSSCQNPKGSVLKSCLNSTRARLKRCLTDKERWTFACQTRCPDCS